VLRADGLKLAAENLLNAALLGEAWESALETLAKTAGARGAVLMRNRNNRLIRAITTQEVSQQVKDYMAGLTPPNSRQVKVSPDRSKRFRLDLDDYRSEELKRDLYYLEFLRPNGFFWHANVSIESSDGEEIGLSFKRGLNAGHYDRGDAVLLDALLPNLRTTMRIARHMLDRETSGVVRMLHQRGSPVFELDAWGRVLRVHGNADEATCPLRIRGRKLATASRASQASLDRAVNAAIANPGAPALAVLPSAIASGHFVQFVPVNGRARDIFLSAAAVGVVIPRKRDLRSAADLAWLRETFGLTERESRVADMISQGASIPDIARALGISADTTRDHLKAAFAKTGTGRQAELVSLLAQIAP
jgi:DNA-binding CsgD family transcriptional regulator